jgi:hypothetical protein
MKISEKHLRSLIRNMYLNESLAIKFADSGPRKLDLSLAGDVDLDASLDKVSSNVPGGIGIDWGSDGNAQARKTAWLVLQPFLPEGAVLTSVVRDQANQDRIIRKHAKKKGYKGNENDLDAMHRFITKAKKMVVARHVGRGHGGKDNTAAFDISGANLDDIWKSVQFVNKYLSDFVKFADLKAGKGKSSIIERDNNAVHVHFDISDVKMKSFDEVKLKEKIAELKSGLSKSASA